MVAVMFAAMLYMLNLLNNQKQEQADSGKTDSLLVEANRVIVELPKPDNNVTPFIFNLTINVDLECRLNDEVFLFEDIKDTLNSKFGMIENPGDISLAVEMDKSMPMDYLVTIMEIAKEIGLKIVLITQ